MQFYIFGNKTKTLHDRKCPVVYTFGKNPLGANDILAVAVLACLNKCHGRQEVMSFTAVYNYVYSRAITLSICQQCDIVRFQLNR